MSNSAASLTVLDHRPTLEEAQQRVGGYVEIVTLPNDHQLLVDEDGLSKQLPVNHNVGILYGIHVVGPAILLSGEYRWMG